MPRTTTAGSSSTPSATPTRDGGMARLGGLSSCPVSACLARCLDGPSRPSRKSSCALAQHR
eukprot:4059031-Lingulodinium_polyedra.AAC.1